MWEVGKLLPDCTSSEMKESSHTVYFQDSCLEVHVYGNPLPICASGSSLNYHCVSKSAHKSFPLFQYHQLLIHKTYNGEFTANASFSFLKHSCHTTYLLNIQNKTVVFCIRDFSQGKKKHRHHSYLSQSTQGDPALGPVRVQIY